MAEAAQRVGRHGHRDASMIQIAYRHALRVSELTALRWDQVDLAQGLLHVRRRKNGNPSTHPLHGPELRALRRLQRDYPSSPYIFTGERKGPLTDSTVRKMVARAGMAAGLGFPVHPHMLRHSGCSPPLCHARASPAKGPRPAAYTVSSRLQLAWIEPRAPILRLLPGDTLKLWAAPGTSF